MNFRAKVCFGFILVLLPGVAITASNPAEVKKGHLDYAIDARCFGVITQTEGLRPHSKRYKDLHELYTAALFMDALPFNIGIKGAIVERDLIQAGPLYTQTIKSFPAPERPKMVKKDYNFCMSDQRIEHIADQASDMESMVNQ